jgi:DNA invertase Pin-like site-specific DNA recombinase
LFGSESYSREELIAEMGAAMLCGIAGIEQATVANSAAYLKFKALGIDFVSYSEQMDTSTPAGKMVFTVLGAVAELERSLIVERVRAGLRNARAKGKTLGRPRVGVDAAKVGRLREQGRSIREIADELGMSRSLVHKTLANRESGRVAIATS